MSASHDAPPSLTLTPNAPLLDPVFNYYFGLMPHRRPIYTVVGEPILVDAPIDIESEQGRKKVDEYHALYCRKLRELFDRYKGEYAHGEELVLK